MEGVHVSYEAEELRFLATEEKGEVSALLMRPAAARFLLAGKPGRTYRGGGSSGYRSGGSSDYSSGGSSVYGGSTTSGMPTGRPATRPGAATGG